MTPLVVIGALSAVGLLLAAVAAVRLTRLPRSGATADRERRLRRQGALFLGLALVAEMVSLLAPAGWSTAAGVAGSVLLVLGLMRLVSPVHRRERRDAGARR